MQDTKDYMIHVHLQNSQVDVHSGNHNTIHTKHNNFNKLSFQINKKLLDNFVINSSFSSSQYDTIQDFIYKTYKKENPTKEDIIVCYIHHRLHHILFDERNNSIEKDFTRIVTTILENTNNGLYKELKQIVKSTVSRCQTSHGNKHGSKNTALQTLKDLWYTEEALYWLSKDKLKRKLKHHKLDQELKILKLEPDPSLTLQEKKDLITQYQLKEENTTTHEPKTITIKEHKKRPKKPLWIREKINLSQIDHYTDEDNE